MPKRTGSARWQGALKDGSGTVSLGSGAFEGDYSAASRFENEEGTNPEELIGAAHAGCYALALSAALGRADHTPTRVDVTAEVSLDKLEEGWTITNIHLIAEAAIADIGSDEFQEIAEQAKRNCPVSRALAATDITLDAKLAS